MLFPLRRLSALALALPIASCGELVSLDEGTVVHLGGPGRRPGRFVTPRAVSVAGDWLFVVDRSGRVQGLTLDGQQRREVIVVEGERGFPIGIVGDAAGGFVLCDTHSSRLRFFDGEFSETGSLGAEGQGEGQFTLPQRIARDDEGRLYVTEYGEGPANRVQVFDAERRFLFSFGSFGTGPGQFTRAMGVAIIGDEVFVADVSDRILVHDRSGRYLREFGTSGVGLGELRYPYGLCAIGDTLYVCEYANHRVQRFDRMGHSTGSFGRAGRGRGEFDGPWDITCDEAGLLYVCDTGNHRVVVFDPQQVPWVSAE